MSFRFKQFAIEDSRCAMKVGTDGVLLGAWAEGDNPLRILDIGSGSGLISLMLAQRFAEAKVVGIDIDQQAVKQSRENVVRSPFTERVEILCTSLQDYAPDGKFDLIVSNPPYFQQSLQCPDAQRTLARHTPSLSYNDLLHHAVRLLSADGSLQLILPAQEEESVVRLAKEYHLQLQRICRVQGRENKPAKRILLHFVHATSEGVEPEESGLTLETMNGHRTDAYQSLAKDFYL